MMGVGVRRDQRHDLPHVRAATRATTSATASIQYWEKRESNRDHNNHCDGSRYPGVHARKKIAGECIGRRRRILLAHVVPTSSRSTGINSTT